KIRAAVVGTDLTVRPVPQMDLFIIGPHGDTTRTSTDLDGSADGSFKDGVYRIESALIVTIAAGAAPAATATPTGAATTGTPTPTTADSAQPANSAGPADSAASPK